MSHDHGGKASASDEKESMAIDVLGDASWLVFAKEHEANFFNKKNRNPAQLWHAVETFLQLI